MRTLTTAVVMMALVAAACTTATNEPPATTTTVIMDERPPTATRAALVPFDACDDLLAWTQGQALDLVGPYGLNETQPYVDFVRVTAAESDDAALAATSADGRATITNLQEAGVDEPDLVKAEGDRIVVIAGDTLFLLRFTDDDLRIEGRLRLEFWTQDLFLDGDRVLALASGGHYEPVPLGISQEELIADGGWYPQQPIVTIAEIDISVLSRPRRSRTLEMDGRYVSSRMVDGAIRVIVAARPTGLAWTFPEGGGLRAEREAELANRQVVRDSTVENWLPYYVLTDHAGVDRVVDEGNVVECSRVHRPDEFSGLTSLSLVTLEDDVLAVADATATYADGEILYSSGDAIYVGTTAWLDPSIVERDGLPSGTTTAIHKFALSPSGAEYRASGAVAGHLLSQWSMSEWDGHLRVASTLSPLWWDTPSAESLVTVLRESGGELRTVGVVDGLGRGERIYAVRFIEDLGYVVTFRQVDPLYVIDLADPTAPAVEGELKIPGYSAYLHPVAPGKLVGVGQDADPDGRVKGTQVSLFDVTDSDHPERIDRVTFTGAHSEVEWDHHAFLHDQESGLTVIPFTRWDDHDGESTGAIVLDIDGSRIVERGTITQRIGDVTWSPPIRRAFLLDGSLLTVSENGILVSDPDSLERIDWVAFTSR